MISKSKKLYRAKVRLEEQIREAITKYVASTKDKEIHLGIGNDFLLDSGNACTDFSLDKDGTVIVHMTYDKGMEYEDLDLNQDFTTGDLAYMLKSIELHLGIIEEE